MLILVSEKGYPKYPLTTMTILTLFSMASRSDARGVNTALGPLTRLLEVFDYLPPQKVLVPHVFSLYAFCFILLCWSVSF